jgi:hypothetical protein
MTRPPYQAHSATSRDAAQSVEPFTNTLQRKVLEAIGDGATDEELVLRTGLAANTVRPRRVELVAMQLLRDSGSRRPGVSGRTATVWSHTVPSTQLRLL